VVLAFSPGVTQGCEPCRVPVLSVFVFFFLRSLQTYSGTVPVHPQLRVSPKSFPFAFVVFYTTRPPPPPLVVGLSRGFFKFSGCSSSYLTINTTPPLLGIFPASLLVLLTPKKRTLGVTKLAALDSRRIAASASAWLCHFVAFLISSTPRLLPFFSLERLEVLSPDHGRKFFPSPLLDAFPRKTHLNVFFSSSLSLLLLLGRNPDAQLSNGCFFLLLILSGRR